MTEKQALTQLNTFPKKLGNFTAIHFDNQIRLEYKNINNSINEILICHIDDYPSNCGALILHFFNGNFTTHTEPKDNIKYIELGYEIILKYIFSRGSKAHSLVYYASDIKGSYNKALKKTMKHILSKKNINSDNIVHHYVQTKH